MYENAQNNFSVYCYYVLGSLTLKENSSGRNGLMADLSVECSSCLEATPLKTSDTITKKQSKNNAETGNSSRGVHSEGLRRKGQEAVEKIGPSDLC